MLRRAALSAARITAAVALILAAAAVVVRQPVFTSIPYLATPNANQVAPRSDPRGLRRHVERLTAGRAGAAAYIEEAFRLAGGVVSVQSFVARRARYANVIATFGSGLPVIVVGAHYDVFNDLPGADDNASGVAGLLELARLLGRQRPARQVVLVAYANEEPPFFASEEMGSAIHAASLMPGSVRGMICLEMIGYFTALQPQPSSILGALFPKRGDFIAVAGGWRDRVLAREVKRALLGAGAVAVSATLPHSMLDASDQRNYWSRGLPAVMVSDTAYIRNPNYHTRGDTAETLDYARMARVVDGIFNAVAAMSRKGQ
jgi:hypothetical protein